MLDLPGISSLTLGSVWGLVNSRINSVAKKRTTNSSRVMFEVLWKYSLVSSLGVCPSGLRNEASLSFWV